ncbi:MAG: hypothetical protein U1D30_14120 [Planctomycetota bacterium]
MPGFSYFQYPGRYGLLAQVSVAVLVAAGADRSSPDLPWLKRLVLIVIFGASSLDYLWVARTVQVVSMVRPPMSGSDAGIRGIRASQTDGSWRWTGTRWLFRVLQRSPLPRPGPAAYYSIWQKIPDLFHGNAPLDGTVFRDAP